MTDYYHTKESATAHLQGAGLTFAGFLDWMYPRWTMENIKGEQAEYSAKDLREYINETMTKEERDAKNIANLNAYMDELGMPKEDRDALPFGTTKTDLLSYAKGYEDAQKAAKEVAEVGGWISVEDRLPEGDEDVFCYSPELDPAFFVGWYYRTDHPRGKNGWEGRISERGESTTALDDAENVTHWQPLPAPPKTT